MISEPGAPADGRQQGSRPRQAPGAASQTDAGQCAKFTWCSEHHLWHVCMLT